MSGECLVSSITALKLRAQQSEVSEEERGLKGTLEPTVTSMHGAREYQQNDVCTEERPPREELTCQLRGLLPGERTG